jgi:hypothetical protein
MDTISRVRSYNLCELLFYSMSQLGSTFAEFVLSIRRFGMRKQEDT